MLNVAETRALSAVQELLIHDAEAFARLGSFPPRTLLLSGPPGVGKSKAVHIAATARNIPLFPVIPGPDIRHRLTAAFKSAQSQKQPKQTVCIVFIDEIDAVCPASVSLSNSSSSSSAIASLLVSLIDPPPLRFAKRLPKPSPNIFVIAATNIPNAVHPSLLRPGRFDRHVTLAPPTSEDRLAIMRALQPAGNVAMLAHIADETAGFVIADLCAVSTAAEKFNLQASSPLPSPSADHFENALRAITPSVLRTPLVPNVPHTQWDDIGGMADVKKRLKMAVEWPLRYADTFKRLGLKRPRGIMLHGPPGCSKTSLVRAAASAARTPFLRLTAADVYSSFVGDSERSIRDAFATARAASPCILFLDEIDAIVGKRQASGLSTGGNQVQQRVLSSLLTEMDGVVAAHGVLVVAATNRVDMLDDALLRPGRFDDILLVGLPDYETRLAILRLYCKSLVLAEDVDLIDLARQAHDWSGADLKSLCSEAGLAAIREYFSRYSTKISDEVVDTYNVTEELVVEPDVVVCMRHFRI